MCTGVAHLDKDGERKYVVIAGVKTGEAVAMPFPDINRDVKTLLGHTTSMIVHLTVNKDSSLLLTGDRDEKIRVSGFPRTSLIKSYCLGHSKSLTKVATSSLTPELAVSTSLDNTIKLWSITSGTLFDSEELLPEELATSKALLNTSLAVSAHSNVVAVVLNSQSVRLFAIVSATDEASRLEKIELPAEIQKQLNATEPAEVQFTSDGTLVVSYKSAPFVNFFHVNQDDAKRVVGVAAAQLVDDSVLAQLRAKFASIGTSFGAALVHLWISILFSNFVGSLCACVCLRNRGCGAGRRGVRGRTQEEEAQDRV